MPELITAVRAVHALEVVVRVRHGVAGRAVADAPADYLASMLRAIDGFEIVIESMTGKFKASQNRSAVDRDGVARGLAADGMPAADVASLVREPRR